MTIRLSEKVAAAPDPQYMDDKYDSDRGSNVDGWIVGARVTVEF